MGEITYKKGLMVQYPCARGRAFVCKNIGDYIQYVAARQFVDGIDEIVDQEEAYIYFPEDKKKIKLIMNGWFQWRAENWPPSEYVYPLLISMHFSPLRAQELLTPEGIEFLRKYGPVGCRDKGSMRILEEAGVPTYFSSCLTLTMGEKFRASDDKREGIYFVDPFFDIPGYDNNEKVKIGFVIDVLLYYLRHFVSINKLAKKDFFRIYSPKGFLDRNNKKLRPYYKATLFFKLYTKKFDKKLLLNAEYITHFVDVDMKNDTNEDLLNMAEDLVRKYASAKLVVTSRIHAGLPSVGLDTPVIFISNEKITSRNCDFNTPGRLEGVLDYFRIYEIINNDFFSDDDILAEIDKIDENTSFKNKTNWKKYASELSKKCKEFMKG